MKKILFIIMILLINNSIKAQSVKELKEYKAKNGITYIIGDTIKLGTGKYEKGKFISIDVSGYDQFTGKRSIRLKAKYEGRTAKIKKIRKLKILELDYDPVVFKIRVIEGWETMNYSLDIESAISLCEIENCKKQEESSKSLATDKYDKLRKLKELLDEGILTEEEFKVEKKKILNGN